MIHLGDKVKFLNQIGGGRVVGFSGKNLVLVEDEDQFEIPMPISECIVMEEISDNTKESDKKAIQTKNGELLNISLAYMLTKPNNITLSDFECYIANESNYHLFITYLVKEEQLYTTKYSGEIAPYDRKPLFKFGKSLLNKIGKKITLQVVAFKKDKSFKSKEPISIEVTLDPKNLLKEGSYKANPLFSTPAYVVSVLEEDERVAYQEELAQLATDISKAQLKELQNNDFHSSKAASNIKKKDHLGVIEIDLHAHELLETTAGMSNSDILKYQLDKFHEAIKTHGIKKGTKMVFIHGKGDGVLRQAIIKELRSKYSHFSYQDASFKEYGYGATMVVIR